MLAAGCLSGLLASGPVLGASNSDTGIVRRPDGRPVAGVTILAMQQPGGFAFGLQVPSAIASARTGPDGRFRFELSAPARRLFLRACGAVRVTLLDGRPWLQASEVEVRPLRSDAPNVVEVPRGFRARPEAEVLPRHLRPENFVPGPVRPMFPEAKTARAKN